jgi:hypothetical protein
MFEDTRSEHEIVNATLDFKRNAKPVVVERGSKGEATGQLLWILVVISHTLTYYISAGIHGDLLHSIHLGEEPLPYQHGPHIIIASEPTSESLLSHDVSMCSYS